MEQCSTTWEEEYHHCRSTFSDPPVFASSNISFLPVFPPPDAVLGFFRPLVAYIEPRLVPISTHESDVHGIACPTPFFSSCSHAMLLFISILLVSLAVSLVQILAICHTVKHIAQSTFHRHAGICALLCIFSAMWTI